MKELKFVTKVLHTKFLKQDPHGSLHMPIYDNVAFEQKQAEDLELAFQGRKPAHMYSRISNPTVEDFEQRVRAVTDAIGVIALSSGMAAISNVIVAICQTGDNIVTSKHLFGNTYSLFENTLKSWGLEVRYADLTDVKEVEKLIDDKTKAIFLETITNPQLEVADIKALSAIAKKNHILIIADTTLTPPYLFKSKDFGVDVEVLSSTKYISGGATSVGGLIIDNGTFDWARNSKLRVDAGKYGPLTFLNKLRREVFRNLGACMSSHNAFLQSIGLETLHLRVDVSCANAQALAEFLEKSGKIKQVNYPGLKSSKYYQIAKKQFKDKLGALLTFDLESKEQCFKFMNKLEIIRRATNLQDNRTLILHPASTIFCEYDASLKKEMGVRETMIRLAVGIEDLEDLILDIKQSLEALK
ncbi:MAG: aminotransferase class I/II-fold pyridoxal phosphate-dependent enzyme [Candidatus Omnitrophota bacterium]